MGSNDPFHTFAILTKFVYLFWSSNSHINDKELPLFLDNNTFPPLKIQFP